MFVDSNRQFVFVAIPKTASKSVNAIFGHNVHPEPQLYHMTAGEVLEQRPELLSWFTFAFVRNPWDKLVSLYHDFQRRGRDYSANIKLEKPLLHEFADFKDFCLRLHEWPMFADVHVKPQYHFVTRPDGTQIDYIGRFENLQNDVKIVCDRLGISGYRLPHINNGNRDNYHGYYDDESREAVAKVYARDIQEFGYEF